MLDIYFNVIQHYLSKGFSKYISLFVMSLAVKIIFFFRAAILRLLWWEDCKGSYWFFYKFHMDHPKTFYQGRVGISSHSLCFWNSTSIASVLF